MSVKRLMCYRSPGLHRGSNAIDERLSVEFAAVAVVQPVDSMPTNSLEVEAREGELSCVISFAHASGWLSKGGTVAEELAFEHSGVSGWRN